jgi:sec-independent protein translocase protein TatA
MINQEEWLVFGLGGTEILLVFVVILLVFGPSQIPKMARGLGQAMREFRKAQREIGEELKSDEAMKPEPPSAPKPPENRPIS